MKIQLGGDTANAKPETSLAEKAKGFKFTTPVSSGTPSKANNVQQGIAKNPTKPETVSDTQPAKSSGGIKLGNTASKPSANNLLGKTATKPEVQVADKPVAKSNPIPEMSNDKYEVVIGASDELSEDAGNKLEEQLGILQAAIDGTGDLKDSMQNILLFLDDNPQYKDNIAPKDMSVFVAACRKVAGITVTEKKTRQTKKKSTSALENDIMADLADLDLQL